MNVNIKNEKPNLNISIQLSPSVSIIDTGTRIGFLSFGASFSEFRHTPTNMLKIAIKLIKNDIFYTELMALQMLVVLMEEILKERSLINTTEEAQEPNHDLGSVMKDLKDDTLNPSI